MHLFLCLSKQHLLHQEFVFFLWFPRLNECKFSCSLKWSMPECQKKVVKKSKVRFTQSSNAKVDASLHQEEKRKFFILMYFYTKQGLRVLSFFPFVLKLNQKKSRIK